ncbi:hypothetical protein J6590_067511 [Homalodisca vitripennis]|nr:hypothetical protein J6590_067511 [Homalodisca vitripennis]
MGWGSARKAYNALIEVCHIRRLCRIFCRGELSKGKEGLRFYLARYERQAEVRSDFVPKRLRGVTRGLKKSKTENRRRRNRTMAWTRDHESCIKHFLGIGCLQDTKDNGQILMALAEDVYGISDIQDRLVRHPVWEEETGLS